MAKTFKNLPCPAEPTAPKPTSERDFFDLSDKPALAKIPAEESDNTRNTSNTGITSNMSNISNTVTSDSLVSTPLPVAPTTQPTLPAESEGVRQTFVLSRTHLEQLRDYVHARRAQGDYTYSQKQALQEGLDLLFAGAAPAPPRPAQTRAQEQLRRQRIQQGRQGSGGSE